MRKYLVLIFLFISIFSYAGIPSDNIVKIRVVVNFIEYTSFVVISSKDYPEAFSIVREELW